MNGETHPYNVQINLGRPLIAGSNLWQEFLLDQKEAADGQNPPRHYPPGPNTPGNLLGPADVVPQVREHGAMAFPQQHGEVAIVGQPGQIELNAASFEGPLQIYQNNPEMIRKLLHLHRMREVSTKISTKRMCCSFYLYLPIAYSDLTWHSSIVTTLWVLWCMSFANFMLQ